MDNKKEAPFFSAGRAGHMSSHTPGDTPPIIHRTNAPAGDTYTRLRFVPLCLPFSLKDQQPNTSSHDIPPNRRNL